MWFWIFMFANTMLMPVLMLGFGRQFQKKPPVEINSLYGYRTKMSRMNMDTWNYAHRYFGKRWFRSGCFILPVTAICMLLLSGKDEEAVGIGSLVIIIVQTVILLLSIIDTEWELRRRFEPDGTRRKQNGGL